ncbi:nucleoside hydrolase [Candidatus Roseilinea sp. NK_OTU-006]|uniref:nucleoside hydrolase n=1 Tax=Candidatus Roseilinea sp. NK_OTU-006 TaxID=2704250 RepID=UPI002A59997E|nr:nucleoside hydrolase [Candidatus Roseilinea sp. NK_OTU-006]
MDFLIETLLAAPGEITLVATGPLTNIALAVRREPRIVPAVRRCIIMGGAFRHEGNMPLRGEYNVWCDPHAARIVLHSGLPITLVPLDVTYRCLFREADMQHIAAQADVRTPIVRFLADATRFYIKYHKTAQNIEGCAINDALAMALAFAPDLVTTVAL